MLTIGADPEIFVGHKGTLLCAQDMIPGTKTDPFFVPNGAVQVDGIALEFNIDPVETEEDFIAKLDGVKAILKEMIGENDFLEQASVEFTEEWAKTLPYDALVLGCTPDYDAWTGKLNPPPLDTTLMRTAGGHVHVGFKATDRPFDRDHIKECAILARLIDEEVGVYSILWDKDDKRRSLYGKAGAFRPKPYGMEYRTLSNAWIFNPDITKFVFRGVKRAVERYEAGDHEVDPTVQDIINSSNRDVVSLMVKDTEHDFLRN